MTYFGHTKIKIKCLLIIVFKGKELRSGRSLVPSITESGNLENVMGTAPSVCCTQKLRSMQGSTAVDGKMERSMYVFDIRAHCNTCMYTF